MIYLYLFSLVVGGILLGASFLLGGHHDAGGGGLDHAADADGGARPEPPLPEGAHDGVGFETFLVSLLSVRFWTFFAAFFGVTGTLFEALGLLPFGWLTALVAVFVGAFAGAFALWVVRKATADESNSAVGAKDYVGKTGRVLVAFGPGQVGKVRLEVKGSTIDLLATPIDEGGFSIGDEALVVELEGTRLRVARTRVSTP